MFGKQLHTIQMPRIANEQEQAFIKAMRNDDFNTILELKMKEYQAIGERTEKPPAGCIHHHLHRCRQNLPKGRDTKKYSGYKACAKLDY